MNRFQLTLEDASHVARAYGTPCYVLDEPTFLSRMSAYREALQKLWPKVRISYASKANSTLGVLQLARRAGLHIDVASEGELMAAHMAGVAAKDCTLHGNAKSWAQIQSALAAGIGEIVADCMSELDLLAIQGATCPIVLRLNPGVAPETHAKIATSTKESKFGFSIEAGHAEEAVRFCMLNNLALTGFHVHTGSQLMEPSAACEAGLRMTKFALEMSQKHGFELSLLNLGGGRGVAYTTESVQDLETYQRAWVEPIADCLRTHQATPILAQEPGRALIAESGITLLSAVAIKPVGSKTFVAVDGGLYENPRPALYDAKYTVTDFRDEDPPVKATIVGSHCENDVLYPDIWLSSGLQPGDLLQVLCTGAYSSGMANNYNRFVRPPTVLKRTDGSWAVLQERETLESLFARERLLPE